MASTSIVSNRLEELESVIEQGLQTFIQVGKALLEISKKRLYIDRGFQTFEDYCQHRWGWSRRTGYFYIEAAKVAENVNLSSQPPIGFTQARGLADLEPEQQIEVSEAIHSSGKTFETVTASDVREIVQEVKAGTPAAMAVHFSSDSEEWYTPPEILARVEATLVRIALDPCSNVGKNVSADSHFTAEDDGLSRPWYGTVYMNPPYGREIVPWVEKLCTEYACGNVTQAIALVPARVDTEWFHLFRDFAICFISGRLKFSGHANSAPFPSAAVYLGQNLEAFTKQFAEIGDVWLRVR